MLGSGAFGREPGVLKTGGSRLVDKQRQVHVSEDGVRGQSRPGLSQAALVVLAQEVVSHLARWADQTAARGQVLQMPKIEVDIDGLCSALVGRDQDRARQLILAAHARGASHDELCLFHIAAAARQLGEMWEEDRITFSHMAVAAGRMMQILRELRDIAPPFEPRGDRCALFATVPGETHTIGATMATNLFRDRGWDVDLRMGQTEAQLAQTLRSGGYPIVGLSVSTPERVRALSRVVVELRLAVPSVLIFIGGNIVRLEPDVAVHVGADASAVELDECVAAMESLYALVARFSVP